ncbi:MAG: hypothetical protein ACRD04_05990 [Terriglobales bacterium]
MTSRDGSQFYVRRVGHGSRQIVISIPRPLVKKSGFAPGLCVKLWWDGEVMHAKPLLGDNPNAEGVE